ncbi:uroporphyrinogen-III C-methyltransferase [Luethyella okanaganae]|uniref:Uroporphyrinogen-III C-methyltransferase n=1 Tax=Luethyella okanaganae TaxID=69372 RepID=A0ABW1VE57_9MICO
MTELYPLGLKVSGRPVLVVGGGPVAARRAAALIATGALVTVVAPEAGAELRALASTGALSWRARPYRTTDLEGAWLVHTATGIRDVDTRVATEAEAARLWCVDASDHRASAAWVPAVTRRDDVTVSVSAGGDPRRAMAIRDAVAHALDTGELPLRRHRRPTAGSRTALGTTARIGSPSAEEPPPPVEPDMSVEPRTPTEPVETNIANSDFDRLDQRTGTQDQLTDALSRRTGTHSQPTSAPGRRVAAAGGRVFLVGGGPGDPGLVTVRARRLLAEADVVVADRLGPRSLLSELGPEVLVIDVGKLPGHHPVPQDEINALLVEHASAGNIVVRLKGGDPYVLGRGGEEEQFCRAAGIPVEVVPGVTSAISVPAAVGIPVTHRGVANGFTVITGHEQLTAIPGGRDHTVILLMGVSALGTSAAALAAGDRGGECPVAVVEDGYGPRQRVTIGTLDTIEALAAERGIRSPAVIVIGDVVTLSPHAQHSRIPRKALA